MYTDLILFEVFSLAHRTFDMYTFSVNLVSWFARWVDEESQ